MKVFDLRVFRQDLASRFHGLRDIGCFGCRYDQGAQIRPGVAINDGLLDFRPCEQMALDPLRRDIATVRGNQNIFAAALDM